MTLTNDYIRLPLDSIFVRRDARQRRAVHTAGLVGSIKKFGVLNPIIVTRETEQGQHVLVAGERRLESSRELGLPDIPARFAEDLTAVERQIIELDENIKRSDLTWQDQCRGIERIHLLYKSLDPEWHQGETATEVGLTAGYVSMHLKVALRLNEERIANAGTVREAFNVLSREDSRLAADGLEDLINATHGTHGEGGEDPHTAVARPLSDGIAVPSAAPPIPSGSVPISRVLLPAEAKTIIHESFLQWAPRYSGRKFNFLHCDFPYGVGLFSANGKSSGAERSQFGQAGGSYDDSAETYFALLDCLVGNIDKLAALSCHLMFWYSEKHGEATRQRLAAAGFTFQQSPLIWHKSDNAGIIADPQRNPRHVYETCLMASRGHRPVVKSVADLYSCPTDKRFHPSTKPEPMLAHFFQLFVDASTHLLDPTCGGGSAIRVAERLGAGSVFGMDADETFVGNARQALRQARVLRGALFR